MKTPRGKLLIIGGAEDKGSDETPDIGEENREFRHFEILEQLLPNGKKKHPVEIITTASSQPEVVMEKYKKAFQRIGFPHVDFINIRNKEEARNPDLVKRIEKAHALLFSGGDQFRLTTTLGSSEILEAIRDKYLHDSDFILAGTSAGAMAVSEIMIIQGNTNEAMLKGSVKLSSGMGFISHCIIDTHFIRRGRFGRLAEAIIMNPACIGIGLGEDTALIIREGNQATCMGSGMVVIIDPKDVGHTNIPYAEEKSPLCVENLRVHILAKGNGFLFKERKFIPSREDLKQEHANR